MSARFATIGHSNRAVDTVIEMLREAEVRLLVDVRAFPRSRSNPAFNVDSFPSELGLYQIDYRHMPALGGRRPRQPDVEPATNALWRVQSFHNYADYALGEDFHAGFAELLRLGEERRVALMCSEAVWWRCHRRLIADYLLAAGEEVIHLMAPGRSQQAKLTPGAVASDGDVLYPPDQGD